MWLGNGVLQIFSIIRCTSLVQQFLLIVSRCRIANFRDKQFLWLVGSIVNLLLLTFRPIRLFVIIFIVLISQIKMRIAISWIIHRSHFIIFLFHLSQSVIIFSLGIAIIIISIVLAIFWLVIILLRLNTIERTEIKAVAESNLLREIFAAVFLKFFRL